MAKCVVLLKGTNIVLPGGLGHGHVRSAGGFYVSCCVDAQDEATASRMAIEELRRHPTYVQLKAWAPSGAGSDPVVDIDEVDVVPWWRPPYLRGVRTGFVFFPADGDDDAE